MELAAGEFVPDNGAGEHERNRGEFCPAWSKDGAGCGCGVRYPEWRNRDMTTSCYIAIAIAALALALAAYPYLHRFWEHHSRRARWHRRLAMIKAA